ncbi:MAG: ribosomal protein S18-alanine N-acetyltransferase [Pseudomonadota bacterium]|nr:ribosomal protein S18-alanine N-acetyltransferase [Pseudomonadota bacterium]
MGKFREISSEQVANLSLDGLYDSDQSPSLDALTRLLAKPAGRAWAISGAQSIQGVVWFSVVQDEAEIIDIRVVERFRRTGIGESLLTQSFEKLRLSKIRSVFLEVRSSNTAALALYKKLGFAMMGRRENYYKTAAGREDALTMRCDW